MADAISRAFGRAAASYDEHAQLQRVVREECIGMAAECWQAGSRVLDLGCGTGAFSEEIRQRNLDWLVTQADLAQGMCEAARKHNPLVVNAEAGALPFADGCFDGLFSSLMLQWAGGPLKVFREMARVVRPGGVGMVSTLTQGTLSELREAFAAIDDAPHVNDFADPAPLTALAVHAGFRLLACEREIFTIYYPDAVTLMRALKAIGASSVSGRRGGMMTPRKLKVLEQTYKRSRKGLPASWSVLYMLLERT